MLANVSATLLARRLLAAIVLRRTHAGSVGVSEAGRDGSVRQYPISVIAMEKIVGFLTEHTELTVDLQND